MSQPTTLEQYTPSPNNPGPKELLDAIIEAKGRQPYDGIVVANNYPILLPIWAPPTNVPHHQVPELQNASNEVVGNLSIEVPKPVVEALAPHVAQFMHPQFQQLCQEGCKSASPATYGHFAILDNYGNPEATLNNPVPTRRDLGMSGFVTDISLMHMGFRHLPPEQKEQFRKDFYRIVVQSSALVETPELLEQRRKVLLTPADANLRRPIQYNNEEGILTGQEASLRLDQVKVGSQAELQSQSQNFMRDLGRLFFTYGDPEFLQAINVVWDELIRAQDSTTINSILDTRIRYNGPSTSQLPGYFSNARLNRMGFDYLMPQDQDLLRETLIYHLTEEIKRVKEEQRITARRLEEEARALADVTTYNASVDSERQTRLKQKLEEHTGQPGIYENVLKKIATVYVQFIGQDLRGTAYDTLERTLDEVFSQEECQRLGLGERERLILIREVDTHILYLNRLKRVQEHLNNNNIAHSLESLSQYAVIEGIESESAYTNDIEAVRTIMDERYGVEGRGIIEINGNIPTLVIPDLHGRSQMIVEILSRKNIFEGKEITYFEALKRGLINVVCLGDLMHTEEPENWERYNEKDELLDPDENMMQTEMIKNLRTGRVIMHLLCSHPNFYCIRGNHDDMSMQIEVNGRRGFKKYTKTGESILVRNWMSRHFSTNLISLWSGFEADLPLLLLSKGSVNRVYTHTVPSSLLTVEDIRNRTKEAITQLTWTDNTIKEIFMKIKRSIFSNIDYLGLDPKLTEWIIGHRPVETLAKEAESGIIRMIRRQLRGLILQINNPGGYTALLLRPNEKVQGNKGIIVDPNQFVPSVTNGPLDQQGCEAEPVDITSAFQTLSFTQEEIEVFQEADISKAREVLNKKYREAARATHPDLQGTSSLSSSQKVNSAKEDLIYAFGL